MSKAHSIKSSRHIGHKKLGPPVDNSKDTTQPFVQKLNFYQYWEAYHKDDLVDLSRKIQKSKKNLYFTSLRRISREAV